MKRFFGAALMAATTLSPLGITVAEAASIAPRNAASGLAVTAQMAPGDRGENFRQNRPGREGGMRGDWNRADRQVNSPRQSGPSVPQRAARPSNQRIERAEARVQRDAEARAAQARAAQARATQARAAEASRVERRTEMRQQNHDFRQENRQDRRTENRDYRQDRRTENRDFRQDRRIDNREDRQDRRTDNREYRQDRQWDRRDYRQDRRIDNRDYRQDRRYDRRDYRADRRSDYRRWTRDWRSNNRYDWRDYRRINRHVYRPRYAYYAPFRDYSYRRLSIGLVLGSAFYGSNYWINDPWYYRLPPAYGPYRWVRYYDDVLLVDTYTGEVVDVIYDFFW